jgi:hypothetical protein
LKAKKPVKYPGVASKPAEMKETAAVDAVASEPMLRTQIYLNQHEYDFVQSEAKRRHEPMAAVIRGFIDEKMELPDNAWTNNPMLEPTPKDRGFDLPEDAAINHDHYLYGAAKKYVKAKGRWVLAEEARR